MGRLELVDGGDRACGELLLVLAARARVLAPGTRVRLVATDPAAAIDLPAWCHLTGHAYLGSGHSNDGRRYYDLQMTAQSRATDPDRPWRLKPSGTSTIAYLKEKSS